ncbi:hypothetical protein ACP275_05G105800 [Erythranthe tilingii]
MVQSIAAPSFHLWHQPIYGSCYFKNVLNKYSPSYLSTSIGRWPIIPSVKSRAMELNKRVYSRCKRADYVERIGCGVVGAIFELEGVLIEYNPNLENQCWLILSREEGKTPPQGFVLRRIEGMKNEQVISEALCWSTDPRETKRMSIRKEEIYRSLHGPVYRFRPGSEELVNSLARHNVPMGLVSTRPRKYLEAGIRAIGLDRVFSVVVAGEDFSRGKPDPEMFVYAGRVMGFAPERCVVFGNSNRTVEAARDARMRCVAVASCQAVYELGAADMVVRRLDEITVVDLKNLADVEPDEFEFEMEVDEDFL